LFEGITVQHTPNVTAATWVFVVMPCAADTGALLYDNEVMALIALDKVDGHAHALRTSIK
jgi:hypothetical protein